MEIIISLAIVVLAALIHASFQLSVSVLTLLRGHAIGAARSRARVIRLTASYIAGAAVMILLSLSTISLVLVHIFGAEVPLLVWAMGCGLALGTGIAIWLFYYRRKRPGTELWIPRSFADHLLRRSKATHHSTEAFSLGMTSIVAEFLFFVPSALLAALALLQLPGAWQLAGIGLYTGVSLLGLLIVWALVGSGRSIASIQKWREDNKRFLQFAGGSALMVLAFFVYVNEVLAVVSGGY